MTLENFIRDHRAKSLSGMKVSDWKNAAHTAVVEALVEAEETHARDTLYLSRWILIGTATVVSIGFWAAVYSIDRDYGPVASVLLGFLIFSFLILAAEGLLRRAVRHLRANSRKKRWGQIRSFEGRIKRLRNDLDNTLKDLEEVSEEAATLRKKLHSGRKRK